MKFFDWIVAILFVVGFIFRAAWAKGYLLSRSIFSLVSTERVSQRAGPADRPGYELLQVAAVLAKGI